MTFTDTIYAYLQAYILDDYDELKSNLKAHESNIYYFFFGFGNFVLKYNIYKTEKPIFHKPTNNLLSYIQSHISSSPSKPTLEILNNAIPISKNGILALGYDLSVYEDAVVKIGSLNNSIFKYSPHLYYSYSSNPFYIYMSLIYEIYSCKCFDTSQHDQLQKISNLFPGYISKKDFTVKGALLNKFLFANGESPIF